MLLLLQIRGISFNFVLKLISGFHSMNCNPFFEFWGYVGSPRKAVSTSKSGIFQMKLPSVHFGPPVDWYILSLKIFRGTPLNSITPSILWAPWALESFVGKACFLLVLQIIAVMLRFRGQWWNLAGTNSSYISFSFCQLLYGIECFVDSTSQTGGRENIFAYRNVCGIKTIWVKEAFWGSIDLFRRYDVYVCLCLAWNTISNKCSVWKVFGWRQRPFLLFAMQRIIAYGHWVTGNRIIRLLNLVRLLHIQRETSIKLLKLRWSTRLLNHSWLFEGFFGRISKLVDRSVLILLATGGLEAFFSWY